MEVKSINSLNLGDMFLLFLGLLICIEIKFYGTFNLTELFLLAVSILIFITGGIQKKTSNFKYIMFLSILWLTLQVFTDFYRNTPSIDALRGFANISFFISNFYALYALCFLRLRRLFLFVFGILISQLIDYFIAPNLYVDAQPWKFGFGTWANMFFIFIAGSIAVQFKSKLKYIFIIFSGLFLVVLNFYLGSRSLGLILFIALIIYLFSEINLRKRFQQNEFKLKHYLNLFIIALISIFIIYSAYGYFASNGYLGTDAQEKFIQQSSGTLGILFGSRQEILVSSIAIYDSPLIGHGSWAKDEEYAELLNVLMSDFEYEASTIMYEGDNYGLIPTHSYLLGAWVYSGIFGAIFWFYVIFITANSLIRSTRMESQYKLFIIYVSVALLWDILFSPLGLYSRTYASFMMVVVLTSKSINNKTYKVIINH